MDSAQVGSQIRVHSRHWARSKARGMIVEVNEKRINPILVEFAAHGIGFDGGHRLWLNENDFDVVETLQDAPGSMIGS